MTMYANWGTSGLRKYWRQGRKTLGGRAPKTFPIVSISYYSKGANPVEMTGPIRDDEDGDEGVEDESVLIFLGRNFGSEWGRNGGPVG